MRRIHFEDRGQDFLWFDIDSDGKVVDCGPFQAWLWVGKKGKLLTEPNGTQRFSRIRYAVIRVEERKAAA
jgi:hypothetical protein